MPPNNSFKPTPCRGIGHVLCATLAHVRRPATGRLNSSVRRQKAFGSCIVGAATCRLRSALLFGRFLVALQLRSSLLCALTLRMRRVARLRKRRSSSAGFPRLTRGFGHGRLKVREARSSIQASVFGQLVRRSASRGSVPPNKSFKPTPCRGVGRVLYATLAHVRRPNTGRLNSGVRRQKSIRQLRCQHCNLSASVSIALRAVLGHVASSVKSVVRAHTSHALRWPASGATIVICRLAVPDPLLRTRPAVG